MGEAAEGGPRPASPDQPCQTTVGSSPAAGDSASEHLGRRHGPHRRPLCVEENWVTERRAKAHRLGQLSPLALHPAWPQPVATASSGPHWVSLTPGSGLTSSAG